MSLREKAKKSQKTRSPRARKADSKSTSKIVLKLTEENVIKWSKNPGRYDLEGIDTKGLGSPVGLGSLDVPRLRRIASALDIKGRSGMTKPKLLKVLKRRGITLKKAKTIKRPARKKTKKVTKKPVSKLPKLRNGQLYYVVAITPKKDVVYITRTEDPVKALSEARVLRRQLRQTKTKQVVKIVPAKNITDVKEQLGFIKKTPRLSNEQIFHQCWASVINLWEKMDEEPNDLTIGIDTIACFLNKKGAKLPPELYREYKEQSKGSRRGFYGGWGNFLGSHWGTGYFDILNKLGKKHRKTYREVRGQLIGAIRGYVKWGKTKHLKQYMFQKENLFDEWMVTGIPRPSDLDGLVSEEDFFRPYKQQYRIRVNTPRYEKMLKTFRPFLVKERLSLFHDKLLGKKRDLNESIKKASKTKRNLEGLIIHFTAHRTILKLLKSPEGVKEVDELFEVIQRKIKYIDDKVKFHTGEVITASEFYTKKMREIEGKVRKAKQETKPRKVPRVSSVLELDNLNLTELKKLAEIHKVGKGGSLNQIKARLRPFYEEKLNPNKVLGKEYELRKGFGYLNKDGVILFKEGKTKPKDLTLGDFRKVNVDLLAKTEFPITLGSYFVIKVKKRHYDINQVKEILRVMGTKLEVEQSGQGPLKIYNGRWTALISYIPTKRDIKKEEERREREFEREMEEQQREWDEALEKELEEEGW
jgi:hypothetical protein